MKLLSSDMCQFSDHRNIETRTTVATNFTDFYSTTAGTMNRTRTRKTIVVDSDDENPNYSEHSSHISSDNTPEIEDHDSEVRTSASAYRLATPVPKFPRSNDRPRSTFNGFGSSFLTSKQRTPKKATTISNDDNQNLSKDFIAREQSENQDISDTNLTKYKKTLDHRAELYAALLAGKKKQLAKPMRNSTSLEDEVEAEMENDVTAFSSLINKMVQRKGGVDTDRVHEAIDEFERVEKMKVLVRKEMMAESLRKKLADDDQL